MDHIISRVKSGCRQYLRGGYPYLWLSVLVFALYVKTLAFRFSDLDDHFLILNNQQHLRGIADILPLFTSSVSKCFDLFYRPLLQLSFLLDGSVGGKSPFPYHLSNVLFHAGAVCALFAVLLRIRYARLFAFTAAALFAVHPLLTQAVAWVPGRNDSLLALFVLVSFLFLIRYREAPSAGRYAFHQLFLACALLTKETAAMAIPVFALYLIFVERTPLRRLAAPAAGWLAVAAAWWTARTAALGGTGVGKIVFPFGDSAQAFLLYLGKIFFPVHLTPYPVLRGAVFAWGIAAVLLVAVLLALSAGKRNGRVLFGLGWLVLFFLPSFISQTVYYDHRAYLPLIGLIFVLAETGGAVQRLGAAARVVPLFVLALIGSCFAGTFIYSDTFINRPVFAAAAVRLSPQCEGAFVNLGNYYNETGEYPKALEAYRQAQRLNPAMAIAYFNAGEVFRRVGEYPAAISEYERAIAADPKFMDPRINLGGLYIDMGKYREAAAVLDAAALVDKDSEGLRFNRAALEKKLRERR